MNYNNKKVLVTVFVLRTFLFLIISFLFHLSFVVSLSPVCYMVRSSSTTVKYSDTFNAFLFPQDNVDVSTKWGIFVLQNIFFNKKCVLL